MNSSIKEDSFSLNPYCSGRKNRICLGGRLPEHCGFEVLILIVVEERIGFFSNIFRKKKREGS